MLKYLGLVAVLVGCSKKGAEKWVHDAPHFTATVPADLKPRTEKAEGNAHNLAVNADDSTRELFFLWAPVGSDLDPKNQMGRYGHEPDNTKIVEQGDGFVINQRGATTYIHKVITTGDTKWNVLCMASTQDPQKDADLIDGCKSLNVN